MSAGTSEKETLIVVSKLKNYIRAASEMNTSGSVADVLSDIVRNLCDQAIANARKDGRKTVMDRDFAFASSITSTSAGSTQSFAAGNAM